MLILIHEFLFYKLNYGILENKIKKWCHKNLVGVMGFTLWTDAPVDK